MLCVCDVRMVSRVSAMLVELLNEWPEWFARAVAVESFCGVG